MPVDRERQRLVREGIEQLRQYEAEHRDTIASRDIDPAAEPQNLAEILAVLAAHARAAGEDEALLAEFMLRIVGSDRDTLLEARHVLAALGYTEIAAVLKRLARNAPRRLTWYERLKARRTARDRIVKPVPG
jgi:hypothetical protein